MLETFTSATFSGQEGTAFRLSLPSGEVLDALLLQVTVLSAKGPGGQELLRKRAPFSLIFRVPAQGRFEQKIYKLEHPAIGAFELFLVPIGHNADGYQCEAIIT